ncbi:MAG: hypothetical protein MH252_05105 [Thermosynechococcaceae cyanobacterium MS004]|nr:hypothetical protein [Thermosynechococcaceae cyanobacterium MS004]
MSSDFDRGIMKFKGADRPIVITLSAVLILGFISGLVWWSLHSAYVFH